MFACLSETASCRMHAGGTEMVFVWETFLKQGISLQQPVNHRSSVVRVCKPSAAKVSSMHTARGRSNANRESSVGDKHPYVFVDKPL